MSARPELAACRLCGCVPREQERFAGNIVRCGNCGLTVKQSAIGEGDAVERWNRLQAPPTEQGEAADEVALQLPLCEAASAGLSPGRAYRFVLRAGCAKCHAWNVWNAYLRGDGPIPLVPHPLLASFCNPGVRVVSSDGAGAARRAA